MAEWQIIGDIVSIICVLIAVAGMVDMIVKLPRMWRDVPAFEESEE